MKTTWCIFPILMVFGWSVVIVCGLPVCAEWHTELIATESGIGHGSNLNLNKKGEDHISYLKYDTVDLMHATFNGSEWYHEPVETNGEVGWAVCQSIDRYGDPHICYYDATNNKIKYAHRQDGHWKIFTIQTALNSHAYMVLDSDQTPHVCYTSADAAQSFRYAVKTPDKWIIQEIDHGSFRVPVIALDSEENVHITYEIDEPKTGLKYAFWNKEEWQIEFVDTMKIFTNALRIDKKGRPVVTYTYFVTESSDDIVYAVRENGTWKRQIIDQVGMIYWRNHGLFLDDSDYPHIVYASGVKSPRELMYATYNGTEWLYQVVDHFTEIGGANISLAENGRMGVLYSVMQTRENSSWDLKYATQTIPMWKTELVENNGQLGSQRTLTFDDANNPCLAYHRGPPDNDLRFARKDGTDWIFDSPDTAGQTGYGLSLVHDAADDLHISYFDKSRNYLKYAHTSNEEWIVEEIAAANSGDSSIGLDKNQNPHIVFTTTTPKNALYFTRIKNDDWSAELVEEGEFSSPYLAFDSQQRPHLVYTVINEKPGLKHATFDGNSWVIEQFVNDDVFSGSCVIDNLDVLHVSYAVSTGQNYTFMYGRRSPKDNLWTFENVAQTGSLLACNSIALDQYANPLIVFPMVHDAARVLKFAYRTKNGWQYEDVTSFSQELGGLSIAVDSSGIPAVSCSVVKSDQNYDVQYSKRVSEPYIDSRIDLDISIDMPVTVSPGDNFFVDGVFRNPGQPFRNALVFFILGIGNDYWFWPEWQHYQADRIPYQKYDIPSGESIVEIIPDAIWPQVESTVSDDLVFYGAVMNESMCLPVSNVAVQEWSYTN